MTSLPLPPSSLSDGGSGPGFSPGSCGAAPGSAPALPHPARRARARGCLPAAPARLRRRALGLVPGAPLGGPGAAAAPRLPRAPAAGGRAGRAAPGRRGDPDRVVRGHHGLGR